MKLSEDIDYLYESLEFKQCPIEVAFMILGKKWSAAILKELLRGVSQFNRIEENLDGINPRILSIRLKEFRQFGLIKRRIITENDEPIKIDYEVTDSGQEIAPILIAAARFSMTRMSKNVFDDGLPRELETILDSLEE